MHNLFKLSIGKDYYKPILVKSGYNNIYIQYESKENYLRELINDYKNKCEWKLQLIADINFKTRF